MKNLTVADLAQMPIQQRIQLVEDLWDSITETPEALELPEWHASTLNERLDACRVTPGEGSPWRETRKRILG